MKGTGKMVGMLVLLLVGVGVGQEEVGLWVGEAPGERLVVGGVETDGDGREWGFSEPTVAVYLAGAAAGKMPAGRKTEGRMPSARGEGSGRCATAVVVCPGGGYKYLAVEKEGVAVARWLNELGVSAFVVRSRVAPYGWPWPVADAQEAVRLVRARAGEWGVDPNRVGIMGFSAGGHLAATVTTHEAVELGEWSDRQRAQTRGVSCRPDFSILVYPVISMEEGLTHGGSRRNLLGEAPSAELVAELSNEKQVRAGMGPVFLVAASEDRVVSVLNSVRFYEACVGAGVSAELHVFEGGGHGFGLGRGMAAGEWTGLCAGWLEGR